MKLTVLIAAATLVVPASLAFAGGASDEAKTHPGHKGYLSSDSKGGGVPTSHFGAHGGPGYPSGAGGWGGAVSDTAKENKGIPNAHSDE